MSEPDTTWPDTNEAAQQLGVSRSTLQRWAAKAGVESVAVDGKQRWDPDELAGLAVRGGNADAQADLEAAPSDGAKTTILLAQLLGAVRQGHRHIETLVSPVGHATREIQSQLIEENKSLRAENQQLWKELRRKDSQIAQLQDHNWAMQKDQRREQLREDAFREAIEAFRTYGPHVLFFAGNKLNPAAAQEFALRGVLAQLSPTQISKLADVLPPEQAALLSAVITELRKDPNLVRQTYQRPRPHGAGGPPGGSGGDAADGPPAGGQPPS